MPYLRQSTACTIKAGPFVDDSDGHTPETALSIAQADVRLSKNGGDFAAKNSGTLPSHDENGYYNVALDTTDTGTTGDLLVAILKSGALLYRERYTVLSQAVYDALVAGSGDLEVALATGAIAAASFAADAITAAALADDALAAIQGASIADLNTLVQWAVGKRIADSAANTQVVYDEDGVTELVTLTYTVDGDEITRTPS